MIRQGCAVCFRQSPHPAFAVKFGRLEDGINRIKTVRLWLCKTVLPNLFYGRSTDTQLLYQSTPNFIKPVIKKSYMCVDLCTHACAIPDNRTHMCATAYSRADLAHVISRDCWIQNFCGIHS